MADIRALEDKTKVELDEVRGVCQDSRLAFTQLKHFPVLPESTTFVRFLWEFFYVDLQSKLILALLNFMKLLASYDTGM